MPSSRSRRTAAIIGRRRGGGTSLPPVLLRTWPLSEARAHHPWGGRGMMEGRASAQRKGEGESHNAEDTLRCPDRGGTREGLGCRHRRAGVPRVDPALQRTLALRRRDGARASGSASWGRTTRERPRAWSPRSRRATGPRTSSIRHLGIIHGGAEDTTSEVVKAWAPAYENYRLTRAGSGTKLEVEADVEDSYAAMFGEMWPKALAALKQVAERY